MLTYMFRGVTYPVELWAFYVGQELVQLGILVGGKFTLTVYPGDSMGDRRTVLVIGETLQQAEERCEEMGQSLGGLKRLTLKEAQQLVLEHKVVRVPAMMMMSALPKLRISAEENVSSVLDEDDAVDLMVSLVE